MNLLIDMLATFRLTRLATRDTITEPFRQQLRHAAMRQVDSPGIAAKVDTLISCPWCVGWWIAVAVVAARRLYPRAWEPVAAALAASAVTGLIADNLD